MKNEIALVENLWVYEISYSNYKGIVLADTKEEALASVYEMYEYVTEDESDIRICKVTEYKNYDKNYKNILEF